MLNDSSASQLSAAALHMLVGGTAPQKASILWYGELGHKGLNAVPAMQAVMKQATVPEIRALIAPEAMSRFLEGAMDAGKHGSKHKRLMLRLLIRIPKSQPLRIVLGLGSQVN